MNEAQWTNSICGESGRLKSDLYDIIDTRLWKLKGIPKKSFGWVNMVYRGDFFIIYRRLVAGFLDSNLTRKCLKS